MEEVSSRGFFILSALKVSNLLSHLERPGSILSRLALVLCLGVPAVGWLLTPSSVNPQKQALCFTLSSELNVPTENRSSGKS